MIPDPKCSIEGDIDRLLCVIHRIYLLELPDEHYLAGVHNDVFGTFEAQFSYNWVKLSQLDDRHMVCGGVTVFKERRLNYSR